MIKSVRLGISQTVLFFVVLFLVLSYYEPPAGQVNWPATAVYAFFAGFNAAIVMVAKRWKLAALVWLHIAGYLASIYASEVDPGVIGHVPLIYLALLIVCAYAHAWELAAGSLCILGASLYMMSVAGWKVDPWDDVTTVNALTHLMFFAWFVMAGVSATIKPHKRYEPGTRAAAYNATQRVKKVA